MPPAPCSCYKILDDAFAPSTTARPLRSSRTCILRWRRCTAPARDSDLPGHAAVASRTGGDASKSSSSRATVRTGTRSSPHSRQRRARGGRGTTRHTAPARRLLAARPPHPSMNLCQVLWPVDR